MQIQTSSEHDIIDITDELAVPEGSGVLTVFVKHTTCALTINEFEPKLKQDFIQAYTDLLPDKTWKHDRIDNNAHAHLVSSIIDPSVSIPYTDGQLQLGTWQRVLLVERDGPRNRTIIYEATPS